MRKRSWRLPNFETYRHVADFIRAQAETAGVVVK